MRDLCGKVKAKTTSRRERRESVASGLFPSHSLAFGDMLPYVLSTIPEKAP
jgi:hypothetical protein